MLNATQAASAVDRSRRTRTSKRFGTTLNIHADASDTLVHLKLKIFERSSTEADPAQQVGDGLCYLLHHD